MPTPREMGTNPRALGTNPKALKVNAKALGTNPRALGLNARALGVNPRAMGVNPRAMEPTPAPAIEWADLAAISLVDQLAGAIKFCPRGGAGYTRLVIILANHLANHTFSAEEAQELVNHLCARWDDWKGEREFALACVRFHLMRYPQTRPEPTAADRAEEAELEAELERTRQEVPPAPPAEPARPSMPALPPEVKHQFYSWCMRQNPERNGNDVEAYRDWKKSRP